MNLLDENFPDDQGPRFRTWSGRSGIVARVHHDGLQFWSKDRISQHVGWTDDREK